jgi:Tol biopolymer transport system component/DNA-binding winged helix-turn-helix (wHTH) protein
MATRAAPKLICRFGPFILDLRSGELSRNGRRIRLQEGPRKLLIALAERPEELITRAELHEKLWPEDTFVDFEVGLNAAMSKLREALSDNPQEPHYIETVRKRGYRFIGARHEYGEERAGASGELPPAVEPRIQVMPAEPVPIRTGKSAPHFRGLWVAFAGAPLLASVAALWWFLAPPSPRLIRVAQVTTDGKIDFLVKPVTDGARVFYLERAGDHWNGMETSLDGGAPQPVPGLPANMRVLDISPAHTTYLLGSFTSRSSDEALWLMPVQGGVPVRLGNIVSGEAVWHPDGRDIVFAKEKTLWIVAADGTNPRLFATLPGGPFWLAWSPDGRRLRLTLSDDDGRVTLWEIQQDGSRLHRVLSDPSVGEEQCCGEWTPDGRYFIYTGTHGMASNLWAQREPRFHLRRIAKQPVRITDLPTGAWGAHVDGKSVLFYAGRTREQIERLNVRNGALTPLAPDGFVEPEYSWDGRWLVLVELENNSVWKMDVKSGDRVPLSLPPFGAIFPRWSPDGTRIALSGSLPGEPATSYVARAGGGAPELLLPGHGRVYDPDWAPDGQHLVAVHGEASTDNKSNREDALFVIDLATRREEKIPNSEGRYFPHWSHDGRYLEAYADGGRAVDIYEFATGQWERVVRGEGIGFPVWSHDSRYLYFQRMLEEGEPVYRLNLRNHSVNRVAKCLAALPGDVQRCALMGLAPDDAPIVSISRGSRDLYRADLSLP